MPQARITVNAVVGSNDDLPINTLVTFDNVNTGGETSFLWEWVYQPPSAANTFSAPATQNPTWTPDVEGSWLVKLTVNGTLTDQVVVAVRQLKTRIRIPAANETTETDAADGWADNGPGNALRTLDATKADPGLYVAQAGGALNAGDVVRVSGVVTIKSGLGQEDIPEVTRASAASLANVDEQLAVVFSDIDGGGSLAAGQLGYMRTSGLFQGLSGAPAAGDPVYVSDAGALALTPGTVERVIGHVAQTYGGVTYDAWIDSGIGFMPSPSVVLGAIVEPTTSPYAVGTGDSVVLSNPAAAAMTINLPAGATHLNRRVIVKDKAKIAATYNVTIVPNGAETIDGAASLTLTADGAAASLVFNGTDWSIV